MRRSGGAPFRDAYNEANDITPQTIIKPIDMSLVAIAEGDYVTVPLDDGTPNPEMELNAGATR